MNWHNQSDSLEQLKSDVRVGDNPQHPDNPDSVRESAARELSKRGYSLKQINEMKIS